MSQTLLVSLTDKEWAQLNKIAKERDRSINSQARIGLQAYLYAMRKREGGRHGKK